ncbi:MAG: molybdenum cofactor guanylyltransferase [Candidatus Omnitrophota bacterium]|nr:molybdenum cofactor guanylyltransferase [Candidatus Omnitrophota bacterium]
MTAIILAGGKSSRFGRDKALVKIDGMPIIKRQINILAGIFKTVLVVTDNTRRYRLRGVKIIRDIIPEKGPLGGIYSGLMASDSFYNFVTACDMPFLNIGLVRYMLKKAAGYDAVVVRFNGRAHPLCAVYTKNCLVLAGIRISKDNLKLSGLLKNVKTRVISEMEIKRFDPEGRCLANLNTVKDYLSLTERKNIRIQK